MNQVCVCVSRSGWLCSRWRGRVCRAWRGKVKWAPDGDLGERPVRTKVLYRRENGILWENLHVGPGERPPIVYLRVHCLCWTFCEFEQMHSGMCASLRYHTVNIFTAPKPSVLPPFIPLSTPPRTPGNHWSVHCCHSFAFSRMLPDWNDTIYILFIWVSFT